MTRTESARLMSLSEAVAQKRLDLHLAKEMAATAEKRFKEYLQEISERDDPPAEKTIEPVIFDYLEKIDEFAKPETSTDVILDGKG